MAETAEEKSFGEALQEEGITKHKKRIEIAAKIAELLLELDEEFRTPTCQSALSMVVKAPSRGVAPMGVREGRLGALAGRSG